MPISLKIEITTPMTEDDKELLSGIAVMTLAVANRQMAQTAFPDAFSDPEQPAAQEVSDDEAAPAEAGAFCGSERNGLTCTAEMGHRGRHRMRPLGSMSGVGRGVN